MGERTGTLGADGACGAPCRYGQRFRRRPHQPRTGRIRVWRQRVSPSHRSTREEHESSRRWAREMRAPPNSTLSPCCPLASLQPRGHRCPRGSLACQCAYRPTTACDEQLCQDGPHVMHRAVETLGVAGGQRRSPPAWGVLRDGRDRLECDLAFLVRWDYPDLDSGLVRADQRGLLLSASIAFGVDDDAQFTQAHE